MAFDSATRNKLQRMVGACRRLLADEFDDQFQGLYGIYAQDGRLLELEKLTTLDDDDYQIATLLRERVKHLYSGMASEKQPLAEAVRRVLREQAFTVLNRFAALRMAEERGFVQECVGQGLKSKGFQVFETVARSGLGGAYERYVTFIHGMFDELSLDLGVLFDRWSPFGLLFPREQALLKFFDLLNDPELKPLWKEDETVGWIYQYFNDEAERKKLREESSAPRNSRELAVRNQFFTPRYVVEFLTDNTLGRIWYEMTQGDTKLREQCRYLVRRSCELFMGGPWPDMFPVRPGSWVERVTQGDLSDLPALPSLEDLETLSVSFDGYGTAERLGYGDPHAFVRDRLQATILRGEAWPDQFVETWLCMFSLTRAPGIYQEWCDIQHAMLVLYGNWRKAATATADGLSQAELLRRPVLVPARRCKDPRQIRLLDPACGSMHFGLYAFDLFEVIYDEAWQRGLIPREEFGAADGNRFPHETVALAHVKKVKSNFTFEELPVDGAYVVVTELSDGGDGVLANTPYIVSENTQFRVPFKHRVPLKEFDYARALREGWFCEDSGISFICDVKCFHHREISLDDDIAYRNYKREVPRLIIEHNLHGIDIDPRCAQIAGLSLWLRAQKAWQRLGLKPVERPAIKRSNIVCAEPMPGEKELLREFVENEFPAEERGVVLRLLETIFDKMQLAGEAGSLLKIEEEIRSAIEDARRQWQTARQRSEFFDSADLAKMDKRTGAQRELPAAERAAMAADLRSLTSEDFWVRVEERIYAALRDYSEQAENGGGFQRRLFAEDAARGFAFIDLCRKRYDVVVMNPPFGASTDSIKTLLAQSYFAGRTDLYACSILRALDISSTQGTIGAITARTGFFLQSFADWRTGLIGSTSVCCFADLGGNVLDSAMVETAAYALHKTKLGFAPFLRVEGDHKADGVLGAIQAVSTGLMAQSTFLRKPQDFANGPDKAWSYWLPSNLAAVLARHETFDPHFGDIRLGVQTNDDFRFSRLWWEVPADLIGNKPGTVQQGKGWVTFLKGGDSTKYFADFSMVLNWFSEGSELKAAVTIALDGGHWSRHIQSVEYYFLPGVSWALRTDNFDPHLVPAGCISSVSRYFAIPRRVSIYTLLGVWNCRMFDFLAKLRMEKWLQPKFVIGVVKDLAFPNLSNASQRDLDERVLQIWSIKCEASRSDECNRFAVVPSFAVEREGQGDATARLIAKLEDEAERIVATEFGYSSSQLGYSSCQATVELKQDSRETQIVNALSFEVGCLFGRWDIRYATGEKAAPDLPDPFAPLPVCPPGQLQNTRGLPARPEDVPAAYPVRVPWDGILVDDPNHPLDIERRVREVIEIIWKDRAEAIEHEACEILGVKSLRDYFRKPAGFFADHLKRYSKSRRQAPIYWPLSTASGNYTLWIYYHRLTDQTLFQCVNDFVKPKLEEVNKDIERLRGDLQRADGGSRQQREKLEELEDFAIQLKEFQDELLRVAGLPYKPNLNDGVLITASPLWKLFRLPKWQKDLKACWESLEAGEYDWAHLAYTIWPDRVKQVCKKDRSIAIAHGQEHLCEVKAPEKKSKRGKKKTAELPFGAEDE